MSTIIPVVVPVRLSCQDQEIPLKVGQHEDIALGMDTAVTASVVPHYDGPYNVTPSTSAQVLDTDGKMMTEDITIDAVQEGSLIYAEAFDVDPEIEIDSTGYITARHSSSGSLSPVSTSGWLEADEGNVTLYFYGEDTKQLPTQGAVTVTPNNTTQTVVTAGKFTTGSITVEPIPSNYGLITWDGSALTVS